MIALKNISKMYSKLQVLNDISFVTPKNCITGIIGPNGAGKSTLIRILTGLEFPSRGSVFINDIEMRNFEQRKNLISYMAENMVLYPDYSVGEFLCFYHAAANYKDEQLLEELSLKEVISKKIRHLSKGWHQRLKLYTALCNNKPIVILDEPFEGFDPLQMVKIIDVIRLQNLKGRSFVLSIHQLSYAQKICDYFVFLDEGILVAEGLKGDLVNRYSTESLEEIFLKVLQK